MVKKIVKSRWVPHNVTEARVVLSLSRGKRTVLDIASVISVGERQVRRILNLMKDADLLTNQIWHSGDGKHSTWSIEDPKHWRRFIHQVAMSIAGKNE